jgi:SAM-dependent methyltransferase
MEMNRPRDRLLDEVAGDLIGFRWNDATLNLDVFGNRVTADQYRIVYAAVLAHMPRGAKVLDWGCGNGHFSYFLLKTGYRVTAFSFLGAPRIIRPEGGRFEFVGGSENEPRTIPFPTAHFDSVMSMGVLEHVRETGGDEGASLAEIRRILKPGGIFVCAHFPNRLSWIEFLTRHFVPSKFNHRFRFTKKDIVALWSAAGFEILAISRYGWLPRNLMSGIRSPILDTRLSVSIYDAAELAARALLFPFHQNFLIVARTPAA